MLVTMAGCASAPPPPPGSSAASWPRWATSTAPSATTPGSSTSSPQSCSPGQIDRYLDIHLLSGVIVTFPLQSSPLIPPRHPQRQDDQEIPRGYREERDHARQNLPGRNLEAESRPDNCRGIFRGGGSCQLPGDYRINNQNFYFQSLLINLWFRIGATFKTR